MSVTFVHLASVRLVSFGLSGFLMEALNLSGQLESQFYPMEASQLIHVDHEFVKNHWVNVWDIDINLSNLLLQVFKLLVADLPSESIKVACFVLRGYLALVTMVSRRRCDRRLVVLIHQV